MKKYAHRLQSLSSMISDFTSIAAAQATEVVYNVINTKHVYSSPRINKHIRESMESPIEV